MKTTIIAVATMCAVLFTACSANVNTEVEETEVVDSTAVETDSIEIESFEETSVDITE
jgi:PBP1b-binding outer membrane lipoprotein LpoB